MRSIPRRMLDAFLNMHELSWWLFTRALLLSCVLLFCSFVFLIEAEPVTLENFHLYRAARALAQLPQVVLLFGILGIALAEDHFNGT